MARLTAAQALIRFLAAQHVERDGVEHRFFAGCFGIFGHGNVAGIGQALLPAARARCRTTRRATSRRWCTPRSATRGCRTGSATLACTTLDRPGRDEHGHRRRARDDQPAAGAAAARRRLRRAHGPTRCCSSSRCRRPATSRSTTASARSRATSTGSRGPSRSIPAALAAMRVLDDPAETGAVTLAFPQDVQAEAFDFPEEFLARAGLARAAASPRPRPRSRARRS